MKAFRLLQSLLVVTAVSGFLSRVKPGSLGQTPAQRQGDTTFYNTVEEAGSNAPLPTINGKRVLPFKVIKAGLGNEKVPAVFATLNDQYKPRTEGWEAVTFVGVTEDLKNTLETHFDEQGKEKVAHVRVLTFASMQVDAMQDMARSWRVSAIDAGAPMETTGWTLDVLEFMESDDDNDDDDDWMEMTADAMAAMSSVGSGSDDVDAANVVSPFEQEASAASSGTENEEGSLAFTAANVDKVLDEVRPYLIADGGNVSVERIDEATKNVYLKLEGACGSCPSSTVTMQMGIERVLKENFDDLGEVLQSEDESAPTELTYEAVEEEVNRLKHAIVAMGGVVEILSVDPIGVVQIRFRGASKVQQGLELALLDVPFVKHVKFTSA